MYQDDAHQTAHQTAQQSNTRLHTNKNVKNVKNVNKNSKTLRAQPAEPEGVQDIFDAFYMTINPTINFGNTTQRQAATDLIKKLGKDNAIKIANYACAVQGERYAPTITTPYQLKEKFAALQIYYEKQKNTSSKILFVS